jgi:hypothetical protein
MIVFISDRVIALRRYAIYPYTGNPVAKTTGFLLMSKRRNDGMVNCGACDRVYPDRHSQRNRKIGKQDETIRRYGMKFLMIVLAVHFVAEMIGNKRNEAKSNNAGERNDNIRHPAEHELR